MKKTIILLMAMTVPLAAGAQVKRAILSEDFTISVTETPEVSHPLVFRGGSFNQMEGFPKKAAASNQYKNFRNVTLADIDGDGVQDILWGGGNRLFAHSCKELLWERSLSGTVLYPPSVANIDKEEGLEIVQATGGSQTSSRIYLLDENGQDLPGWPLSFNGHWIITAPALSDVNDDGYLEIIFNERDVPAGRVHLVNFNGTPFSADWPVSLSGTPAVTPSVGDVDQDGEKEIYVTSTTTRYLFGLDGEAEAGWPQETGPQQRYSFQSPLLVDLDRDGRLEIIGAAHGDNPEYYALKADGSDFPGWPKPVPDNVWTFSTPTVVSIGEEYQIFMSRPIGTVFSDMLYGWDGAGNSLPGFPLFNLGGLEGLISIADVDGDDEFELLFGSNQLLSDGRSFIHAYEMDGSTDVPGFPIRPWGWTFMNGANVGDVNGDGLMDLVALTYTQNFDANLRDSVYLNVYELNIPYQPERVLWSTYKGNNTRDGLVKTDNATAVNEPAGDSGVELSLYPNPVNDVLQLNLSVFRAANLHVHLCNAQGKNLETIYSGLVAGGAYAWAHPVHGLPPGMYCLRVESGRGNVQTLKFIKL